MWRRLIELSGLGEVASGIRQDPWMVAAPLLVAALATLVALAVLMTRS